MGRLCLVAELGASASAAWFDSGKPIVSKAWMAAGGGSGGGWDSLLGIHGGRF